MADDIQNDSNWIAVVARSLSYLCLNNTSLKDKTLAQRATFLVSLGLDKNDIANMQDSTPASISELIRQTKSKKTSKAKNGKKTNKPKKGK